MITQLKNLKPEEKNLLLKMPVLISLLAASNKYGVNERKKADAIMLAHMKTFSAHPDLIPYYKEVENGFNSNFEEAEMKYSPFNDEKLQALKQDIHQSASVLSKLDKEYALLLHESLSSYAEHVKQSGGSTLENFIIPVPIFNS